MRNYPCGGTKPCPGEVALERIRRRHGNPEWKPFAICFWAARYSAWAFWVGNYEWNRRKINQTYNWKTLRCSYHVFCITIGIETESQEIISSENTNMQWSCSVLFELVTEVLYKTRTKMDHKSQKSQNLWNRMIWAKRFGPGVMGWWLLLEKTRKT